MNDVIPTLLVVGSAALAALSGLNFARARRSASESLVAGREAHAALESLVRTVGAADQANLLAEHATRSDAVAMDAKAKGAQSNRTHSLPKHAPVAAILNISWMPGNLQTVNSKAQRNKGLELTGFTLPTTTRFPISAELERDLREWSLRESALV